MASLKCKKLFTSKKQFLDIVFLIALLAKASSGEFHHAHNNIYAYKRL